MTVEYLFQAFKFLRDKQIELGELSNDYGKLDPTSILRKKEIETGGVFYYKKTGMFRRTIMIEEFVEVPNALEYYASNTAVYYLPDGQSYRKAVITGFERGYEVGDWHTHHGNADPSAVDSATMKEKAKVASSAALLMIIHMRQAQLFVYPKPSLFRFAINITKLAMEYFFLQ